MSKVMVEPSHASAIASRKLPAPLSAFVVTIGSVKQLTTVAVDEPVSFSEVASASLTTVVSLVYCVPSGTLFGTWPTNVNTLVVFAATLAIEQVVVAAGTPQFQEGPEVCEKDTKVMGKTPGTPAGR